MADKVRIFLDAGHGGYDSGAVYKGRKESEDNLKLVLAIGKELIRNYSNVVVGYARKTDIFESVTKKRQDANSFNADYVFSFHRNSFNGKAAGFETLYYSLGNVKDDIRNDIADEMSDIGFVLRGDKQRQNLGILRADAPALLFETGFIDNPSDNTIYDKKFDAIVDAYVYVIAKNCGFVSKTSEKEIAPGDYNSMVQTTKKCPIRKGRGTAYKKLGTLKKGDKVKVLYISKNKAGNLWGSIDYGDDVGYIYMKNVKAI